MQFANPIWLYGLTGLLIPIGIHLLSRKESNVIYIGSLRHLEESNTKRSVSLRLNEVALLALRCLLVVLIVLLLSGLYWERSSKESWLLIETGLETDPDFKPLIDSLQQKGFKTFRLAENFPDLQRNDIGAHTNYWRVSEELSQHALGQVVVLSHNYANGFKGKRIAMPENMKWISKNPTPAVFTASAVRISPDSMIVRTGHTSPDLTTYDSKIIASPSASVYQTDANDSVTIASQDSLMISVVFDAAFEYDKTIISASLRAVDDLAPTTFIISSIPSDEWKAAGTTDWLIWLSEKPLPLESKEQTIRFKKSISDHAPLLRQDANGWMLGSRLNEGIALHDNLALQLASILLTHERTDQHVARLDRRVVSDQKIWSYEKSDSVTEIKSSSANAGNLSQWLTILLLTTLIAERLLAFKRNQ